MIVEAVGASANTLARDEGAKARAQAVQDAMTAAVAACYAQGITDPVKVHAAMMEARACALVG